MLFSNVFECNEELYKQLYKSYKYFQQAPTALLLMLLFFKMWLYHKDKDYIIKNKDLQCATD